MTAFTHNGNDDFATTTTAPHRGRDNEQAGIAGAQEANPFAKPNSNDPLPNFPGSVGLGELLGNLISGIVLRVIIKV